MGCDFNFRCLTPRKTWMLQYFMHFTLGPSLQLGRWDSPGPPARAEAVLLWPEQPGSKLQEPGPLCHHQVRLTCKFANTSPPFWSGLPVPNRPSFYSLLLYLLQHKHLGCLLRACLSAFITSSWVFVSALQFLQQISPSAVFDLPPLFQIVLVYPSFQHHSPYLHELLYFFVSWIW